MKIVSLSPSTIEPFEPNAIETSSNSKGSPMQEAANKMQKELEQQNAVANGGESPKVPQTPETKAEVSPGAVTNTTQAVPTVYAGDSQEIADANAQQAAQNSGVQAAQAKLDNEVMDAKQVKQAAKQSGGAKRKSRKQRKSRKSRKSSKQRKSRKSKKNKK